MRKLMVRDCAKHTTQVLVKDKPPYSVYFTAEKYVKEGKRNSEERETKLQLMRDRLAAENSKRD